MPVGDRAARALALCVLALACSCAEQPPRDPIELRPGAGATVDRGERDRTLMAAPDLTREERQTFYVGRSFARNAWVLSPASTSARDGLGPLFGARACVTCHVGGGRGRLGDRPERPFRALVIRFGQHDPSVPLGHRPDPLYGDQLQPFGAHDSRLASDVRASMSAESGARLASFEPDAARDRALGEGRPRLRYEVVEGRYADGEAYSLRRPILEIDALANGPLAEATRVTARMPPPLFGLGLLEAIPAADLLSLEDPDDRDGDGISGRAARVPDRTSGETVIGRFGWKATQPTVLQQSAAAFRNDMGITSTVYPEESCTAAQTGCQMAPSGRDQKTGVEIADHLLDGVAHFTARLAVPAPREPSSPIVRAGRRHFAEAGCEGCHVPTHRTHPDAPSPGLAGQRIAPFTDLLLHDMGPELASPFAEYEAAPEEWRTPPLWGVGVDAKQRDDLALLHDGRARTLAEAILWHGGEAQPARDRFTALSRSERNELITFLESL